MERKTRDLGERLAEFTLMREPYALDIETFELSVGAHVVCFTPHRGPSHCGPGEWVDSVTMTYH